MKIKWTILLLFLSFTLIQAGSVLSSKGLGTPVGLASGRSMGMGGVAIAVPNAFDLPRINPAGLYQIQLARFAIQYSYESNHYTSDEESAHSPHSNFDGFNFGFPIASRGALAFNLVPYTHINYKTSFPSSIDEQSYIQVLNGTGGVNTLNLSGSYRLFQKMAIGITGHFYFGRLEKNWIIDFSNSGTYTTKDTYATKVSGSGLTLGLQVNPVSGLTTGVIWTPEVTLDSKTYLDYKSMDDDAEITYIHYRDTLNGNIKLPATLGFGLGWRLKKWLIGSDVVYTDWKTMKVNGEPSGRTQSTVKLAVGCEYTPSANPYASLFNKSAYRLGFSYSPYYIKDNSGDSISEWRLTAGFGIPIWNNTSRANFAFSYGQRGDLETNGLSEKLFRITLSLDAGEKWFVRRR